MADSKTAIEKQFSKNPEKYRDEKLFAAGDDLQAMIQSVHFKGNEKVLDIGTGAGHTALKFAPFVEQCFGLDLTEEMVQVAAEYAKNLNVHNVSFLQGDAECLPFPDSMFDIVTCRYAAHHFPNVRKAVQEITRVLKDGGHFILIDHYAPEDMELDHFINELNKMRDPSQIRESSLSEWKAMFAENSLVFNELLKWDLPIEFASWIDRAGASAEVQKKIVKMLRNASPLSRETFQIAFDENSYPQSFFLKAVLLQGTKSKL